MLACHPILMPSQQNRNTQGTPLVSPNRRHLLRVPPFWLCRLKYPLQVQYTCLGVSSVSGDRLIKSTNAAAQAKGFSPFCTSTLRCPSSILKACTVKKGFPSPAGMSLTKLPLGRNNSVMTSLFPPRESLVMTSRLGTGHSRTFFYSVVIHPCECTPV